jgi:hypothetical protein
LSFPLAFAFLPESILLLQFVRYTSNLTFGAPYRCLGEVISRTIIVSPRTTPPFFLTFAPSLFLYLLQIICAVIAVQNLEVSASSRGADSSSIAGSNGWARSKTVLSELKSACFGQTSNLVAVTSLFGNVIWISDCLGDGRFASLKTLHTMGSLWDWKIGEHREPSRGCHAGEELRDKS